MNINELEIINRYKSVALQMLRLSFPTLSIEELEEAVNWSILKRMKNSEAVIENNYKKRNVNSSVLEIAEYIMKREPIITAYGVMFKKHGEVPNPVAKLLQTFMEGRDMYKKEMFKYPKGSEEFEKYNLLQLLAKIDANGFYGAMGNYNCLYYNVNVASSVTTQGRSCISAAALQFEMFLNNNVKFGSLNEVVTFIHNVINEKRTFNDNLILDRHISLQECFTKVMMTCGFEYIPSEEDLTIVWEMMTRLKQEDLNRLYYKNNLYEFVENQALTNAVIYMLKQLNKPYLNPNKVPKEIEVELPEFWSLLEEYVYYSYQMIDRIDRVENMTRSVVAVIDTDSNFLSLDAWYRFILNKVYDIPMTIKTEYVNPVEFVDADEFGDREPLKAVEFIDSPTDYNFYTDEVIEMEKTLNPIVIIPQECLRYSIINIIAYCLTQVINDYMKKYTMQSNSYSPDRKCLLIMKNEFLFKRVMLTNAKKNYASIQELQEGNVVGNKLDLKGLSIAKSGTPKATQETLKNILYEDILNVKDVDQLKVLKELAKCENEIYQSLLNKKKTFYKPVTVKSINTYENPMGIQGIKASVVYNALRDEHLEAIDLYKRNSIDLVKVNITPKNVENIKELYPDIYTKLLQLFKQKEFTTGITTVAIPKDVEAPDWVVEFIDYANIINDNICNFPLESIGLHMAQGNVNYTNILKI